MSIYTKGYLGKNYYWDRTGVEHIERGWVWTLAGLQRGERRLIWGWSDRAGMGHISELKRIVAWSGRACVELALVVV